MITQARLKELLTYDPETGYFTRNVNVKGANAGERAGTITAKGYIAIGIDRKHYLAHRLAFLYMTGQWPKELVDHKDTIKINNKWENLREATNSQNKRNVGARKTNKSGLKGIMKTNAGFAVTLRLGVYPSLEEATKIYNKAVELFHGDFAFKQ